MQKAIGDTYTVDGGNAEGTAGGGTLTKAVNLTLEALAKQRLVAVLVVIGILLGGLGNVWSLWV